MKRIIPLLFLVLFITVVGCKYEGLQVREATPEDIALAQASDEQKQFLAEEAARLLVLVLLRLLTVRTPVG
jgi:hypothetical protein